MSSANEMNSSKEVVFILGPFKKKFPVLRGLLMLASPVFREQSENKKSSSSLPFLSSQNEIVLNNVDSEAFAIVVDYISGREKEATKKFSKSNIGEVVYVTQQFQIQELNRIASQYFLSIVSNDNFMNFYRFALQFNDENIEAILWWWMFKKSKRKSHMLITEIFLECNEKQLSHLLQQGYCSLAEEDLFNGVLHWLKKQYNSTSNQRSPREMLSNIYPHIRFPLMKNEFLANEVYNSGVLTNQELLNIYRAKSLKNLRLTPFSSEKRVNHLSFAKITSSRGDDEEKQVFDHEAQELTSVRCVGDSGTWEGWPATSMLLDDGNYWCTPGLNPNSDVWCIFDVGEALVSQMLLRFQPSYACTVVHVFTGESATRNAEWEKLGEKNSQSPDANVEIVFREDNQRYIMLKFENWPAGLVGVDRVKFYLRNQ